ncbi:hypothetical protein BDZ97DRAFT_1607550, partial [Flammula alnicola]
TSWRAEDYVAELTERSTGQILRVEAKLRKKFPPIYSPTVYTMDPCIVTDIEGNILLWYLPRALTAERTVQMWDDMNLLDKSLRISKGSTSWRIKPTFFRAHPGWLKPGNASMSPAWFQQAHEKSNKLEVSVELAKNHSLAWLRKQVRGSALVGGILSIIHPELYAAGMDALRQLNTDPRSVHKGNRLAEILRVWSSPFT